MGKQRLRNGSGANKTLELECIPMLAVNFTGLDSPAAYLYHYIPLPIRCQNVLLALKPKSLFLKILNL